MHTSPSFGAPAGFTLAYTSLGDMPTEAATSFAAPSLQLQRFAQVCVGAVKRAKAVRGGMPRMERGLIRSVVHVSEGGGTPGVVGTLHQNPSSITLIRTMAEKDIVMLRGTKAENGSDSQTRIH
eukprot:1153171-Pelagomonas_calceolata.AAC.7